MTILRNLTETQAMTIAKQHSNSAFLKVILLFSASLFLLAMSNLSFAQEETKGPNYAYVGLEPDIVTNYAGDNSKKLGYVRVTIEMMVLDPARIMEVEHHMPLLRASAIEILGAQQEDKIRSLTGRENIRRMILQKFKDIMKRETGEDIIEDIIFTKYLRQGG